jgi:hypothetical protein
MSFIGATGLNTFDEEIENTSNYTTRISLDSSNYTSNVNFNSSNYTSNVNINNISYTGNVNINSSNYTERINNELSDRIGFPAALFPFQLPTGVYYPLKQQEVILGEVGNVVGLHTLAIAGIEEQIVGLVGTGGIIGIITGGFVGTALTTATNAQNTANSANNKVDNLIISTTTDKVNTSNYIINTSNIILTNTSNYIIDTSNILINNTQNKIGIAKAEMALIFDIQIANTSNYVRNTSNIITTNSSNYVLNTSNIISTRITNLPNYVLPTANSGTLGGVRVGNSGGINMSGDGTIFVSTPFTNVITSTGSGQFQTIVNAGTQLNNPTLGKLYITTVANSLPEIVNSTMKFHLEVNGMTKIIEAIGTTAGANNGSIVLDHENNGGASSITFRSKSNRGSDYGYIQYQDALSIGGAGESARLIIGVQNDGDDHICLLPSGNVGIGFFNPTQKLDVLGNIRAEGTIFSTGAITSISSYVTDMRTDSAGAYFGLGDTGNYYSFMRIGAFGGNNFIQNNGGRNFIVQMNGTTRFQVLQSGTTVMSDLSVGFTSVGGDMWHNGGGRPVFYFGGDGRNYYRTNAWDGHNWRNNNDVTVMFLNSGGDLYCGRFINWSDSRIKKDIVDIDDAEGLEKILSIQPKKYKYIDETKGTHEVIGFIAQQVKEIIPHAVSLTEGTLPNGEIIQDFHYLDKMAIYTLNVCATQELHRMIGRQQVIIDSLISRIEALES